LTPRVRVVRLGVDFFVDFLAGGTWDSFAGGEAPKVIDVSRVVTSFQCALWNAIAG
jgi:hypothetical protein